MKIPITIAINHFGLIIIKGENTAVFLQGQLTCNVREVNETQAVLGACCNNKGRMIANFFILQKNQEYYLLLPKSMIQFTIAHLKKYAIFSKVELKITDQDINYNVPEIVLKELDENSWCAINISSGFVWIYPKTSGVLIPQMINLQKWGGVSFIKGCFIGQEVIARTEYIGKLKRHLYRAVLNSQDSPKVGDSLKNYIGQSVGIVVETAKKNASYEILAVIQDIAAENGNIFLNHLSLQNLDLITFSDKI